MMSWIAAASFYAGAGLFIIALVDLVYALFGLGGTGNASRRKCELPDRNNQCDGCEDACDLGLVRELIIDLSGCGKNGSQGGVKGSLVA